MDKIRFGIVGTGNIAHRFASAIKNTPCAQLAAVASRTKEGAAAFSREFDIPQSFDSYEAMAQSGCIDAAYIAVPHSAHITCSMLMMNGGKHVLCEKPMAVNAREAQAMFQCAERNNVMLMEGMAPIPIQAIPCVFTKLPVPQTSVPFCPKSAMIIT